MKWKTLALVGLCAGGAVYAMKNLNKPRKENLEKDMSSETQKVDKTSSDSFPASDAPSWAMGGE